MSSKHPLLAEILQGESKSLRDNVIPVEMMNCNVGRAVRAFCSQGAHGTPYQRNFLLVPTPVLSCVEGQRVGARDQRQMFRTGQHASWLGKYASSQAPETVKELSKSV